MALGRRISGAFCVLTLICLSCVAAPLRAQVPQTANFLAEHYDVSASLDAIGQSISATAKIDFKAVEASSSVRVELHPNLIVKEIKGADGKPLTFERDSQNPLIVIVQLPTPVATAGHVTLTYTYAALLVNEENSTVPGVRAALISKDGAYLVLPARWFPLTNFPSNRYTATFRLNVPDSFAGACHGERIRNVEAEGGGVAIRRKIGKREPARGEKQEGTIAIDGGGTDAGDGAVLLVGERAGVRERERHFATRRHGRGQVDDEVERILRVAFKGERFSFGGFHIRDVEIGVQLDADGAGDVVGFELDPGDGGHGLRDCVEGV